MSEEKILTKKIAEQFLDDHESIELSNFVKIEDSAAKSFSKFKGYELHLGGLDSLSDVAAKSLAKIDSQKLRLTDELEKQVAKYR